jgi:hypothetical protein
VREPFLSRWAFDVELFGRLFCGSQAAPSIPATSVWEEPLHAWRDVKGSKLSPRQMARALTDLARIARDLAGRRARQAGLAADRGDRSIPPSRPVRDIEPARVSH